MPSRRSSRQRVRATPKYVKLSDDSDQEPEKRPRNAVHDDDYQDPAEKRAKPATNRVKPGGHASSQAQSPTVAAPSNPELAIERKEEINCSSTSDAEHQDLLTQHDKRLLKRVKTDSQDLQISSAVATSAPEPAVDSIDGEKQDVPIQSGEPSLKRARTDSQDLQVSSTVATSAPEPELQRKTGTSTGSASNVENQCSETQHKQPPTKRIKIKGKDLQVSPAVGVSTPNPGTERKTEKNTSILNDDGHQEFLTQRDNSPTLRANTGDQGSKSQPAVATSPDPDDVDRKPGNVRVILPAGSELKLESPSRPSPRNSKSKTVEQRIAAVERQVAEIKRTHRREMEQMTERRVEEVGKVTDDIIERQWVLLDFNINSIAIELSQHLCTNHTTVLTVVKTRLPRVALGGISEKTYNDMKRTLLNSFMWSWVYTDFFLGHGSLWGRGIVQEIQMARRKLIANREATESRSECAKWLAQAHRLAVVQPNKEVLGQLVHEFSDALLSMILPEEQEKCHDQLKANLDNVVRLATDLTELFLSSKALLVPDWPCRESEYRRWGVFEVECEYLTDEESRERFLVKSPGLEKYGNADGENHHLSTVLRKPQIVYY